MLRKYTLFKRFPYLFGVKEENSFIVEPDVRSKYPALAADFEALDQELMPYFWQLDNDALSAQNWFRLGQVVLIIGTASATILGAIQAALPNRKWPGIMEAVLAAALASVILITRTLKLHENYFTNRLKAERLRGEYFLFLGRAEPYGNDAERIPNLIRRVADIRDEEASDERAQ